jgi:DNA-binding PadR family transcriptional regulator
MTTEYAAVLAVLPGEGYQIRQRLDWTHEQTYRTLVRLYDRGMVRMTTRDNRKHGTSRRIWELAEDA